MIVSKPSYLKGQKALEKTLLLFYAIYPLCLGVILYFLNIYFWNQSPFILCSDVDCLVNPDIESIDINFSYYFGLCSIITFLGFYFISSFIIWLNSDNTYNEYNSLSAKLVSIVFGFLFFSFFLFFVFLLFINPIYMENILRDFMIGLK